MQIAPELLVSNISEAQNFWRDFNITQIWKDTLMIVSSFAREKKSFDITL